MANKKKQQAARQRKQRQQKKQQRRHQRQQRRQTGENTESTYNILPSADLPLAIAPELLADFGAGDLNAIFNTLMGTESLFEEPEYDAVIVDPTEVLMTYFEHIKLLGIDLPDDLDDKQAQTLLEQTLDKTATPELCRQIVVATEELRSRARAEGNKQLLKQAAALQIGLEVDLLQEYYSAFGFLRNLITQNLDAGFYIMNSHERAQAGSDSSGEGTTSTFEVPPEEDAMLARQLDENSAFRRYMYGKIDAVHDQGIETLMTGELQLELFRKEELREAVERLVDAQAEEEEAEAEAESTLEHEDIETDDHNISPSTSDTPLSWVHIFNDYLMEILTPQRNAELLQTLAAVELEEQRAKNYIELMVRENENTDIIHFDPDFLILAMWNQAKPYLRERDLLEEEDAAEEA